MFLFIAGVQPKTRTLEKRAEECAVCGKHEIRLKRTDQYISFFFIPLLRLKKGVPFPVCGNCGTIFDDELNSAPFFVPRCPHCGRARRPDYIYCPTCGKKT